jgi:uncharacterized membrane protein YeaQ/YmgE (transglycosylase-associated protein family)
MSQSPQLHDLVWFLITGGLIGWIASLLVQGSGMGVLADIVVGIIGSLLGSWLAGVFGIGVYGFWGVFAMSIVGAIVLIVILRLFRRASA